MSLETAVERVISNWCDAEAGSYEAKTTIRQLWARAHPVSPPFDKNGAPKLVGEIHQDAFLKDCGSAQEIEVGHFLTGGGIQTVGDLFDLLNPCA